MNVNINGFKTTLIKCNKCQKISFPWKQSTKKNICVHCGSTDIQTILCVEIPQKTILLSDTNYIYIET